MVVIHKEVIDMDGSSDYVQLWVYLNSTSGTAIVNGNTNGANAYWGAFRLIGV